MAAAIHRVEHLHHPGIDPLSDVAGQRALGHHHWLDADEAQRMPARAVTDFDFALWIGEWGRGAERVFILEYDRTRFDRFDVRAAAERYFAIVRALAASDGGAALPAAGPAAPEPLCLRVAASFSADPIREVLDFWAEQLDLPLRVSFAGYGQVLQELLDPGSALRRNRGGANVVLLRAQDWIRARADHARLMADPAALQRALAAAAAEHVAALTAAAKDVPLIVSFAPPSVDPAGPPAIAAVLQGAEEELAWSLSAEAGIAVVPWAELATRLSVRTAIDRLTDELGHVPLNREGFAALGTAVMRRVHETLRRPTKVIVADCDNTLWAGVVGEAGTHGIVIEERHRRLQAALVAASRAGFLVCLCSKNREKDVLDVFAARDDMVLRREHLTAWRINWEPKSANIHDLARMLDLGIDSVVVLDDNPLEIAEITTALPTVTAIQVPTEGAADYADHLWPLDRSHTTAEDRARVTLYRREADRHEERLAAPSYSQFLASLALKVRIEPPGPDEIERVAQLTARTNQFNIDPEPRRADALRRDMEDPARLWLAVHVEDRFGAYGLVGVLGAQQAGEALRVDTFLMSCRVLGRGVEHRMVNAAGHAALARGLGMVELGFRTTDRNMPARRFLDQLSAERIDGLRSQSIYRFAADAAAGMGFLAAQGEADLDAHAATSEPPAAPGKTGRIAAVPGPVFAEIAVRYATAGAVEQAVWSTPDTVETKPAQPGRVDEVATTVRRCAAEVLGLQQLDEGVPLGRYGISSLATMRLVAALRRALGTPVDFSDISESETLDELVTRIRRRRRDDSGAPRPPAPAEADLTLVRGVVPRPIRAVRRARSAILVTGATGFLGAHLVGELVRQSDRRILCLIRPARGATVQHRLHAALMRSGQVEAAAMIGGRIAAVVGDLDQPQLGLAAEQFAALADAVGLVLHNAATVSFAASYEALRRANVLGTLEMIRLAQVAGAPLHFVSTLSIFDARSWLRDGLEGATAGEQELPDSAADILHGYAQTKYVSERHLHAARARGLVCSIYRPGNISGDSRSGAWVAGDAITRLLRASIDIGLMPDRPRSLDLTPVDYVARAITALALTAPEADKNFHIVNPDRISTEKLAAWCCANGFPVATAPAPEWLAALGRLCRAESDHPAAPILPLFHEPMGDGAPAMLDLVERRPIPDRRQAELHLQPLGIACPPIDAAMFGRSLDALVADGFLPSDEAPLRSVG